MQRHVRSSQVRRQAWKQERHEPSNPLHGEQEDRDEAHPRMQAVQVGNGFLGQVVGIKDGLEANDGEEEGRQHDTHVDQLQLLLPLVSEHSVNQNPCEKTFKTSPKNTKKNTHHFRTNI